MPSKHIRIDMEAYNLLLKVRKEGESFSQVIKRKFPPVPPRNPEQKPPPSGRSRARP